MGRTKKSAKYLMKQEVEKNLKEKSRFTKSYKKDEDSAVVKYQECIYSTSTFKVYLKECNHFVDYCYEQYNCKNLSECRKYVTEYLKDKEHDGKSASSIRTYANAIAKLYTTKENQVKSTDFNYEFKKRKSNSFTKNRKEVEYENHFSYENNADLVKFVKMCGLRRNELEHLKYEDLHEKDGKLFLNLDGKHCKHGKARVVEVLATTDDEKDFYRDYLYKNTKEKFKRYFGKVHAAARIHRFRAEYAYQLYRKYERDLEKLSYREKYIRRNENKGEVYDRESLEIVSASLGHTRKDVVVNNYLYVAYLY